jgi:hypothetical protein
MNKLLIKTCKIHGELKPNDIYFSRRFRMNKKGEKVDHSQLCCKICRSIINKRYQNSARRREYDKKWKKENKDKNKEYQRKSLLKNREKNLIIKRLYNKTENARKWKKESRKKNIDLLRDEYLKELIVNNSGIDRDTITPELIEAKRAILKLKRLLKGEIKK